NRSREAGMRGLRLGKDQEHGFTLIEILVVMVILGLLAAVVVPRLLGRTDDARRTATKIQIRSIEQALQLYKLTNGSCPATEPSLGAVGKKPGMGLNARHWRE